ncbi:hypothetical protein [Bradyrhizobium valentinum]|uniref:Uncharacterized protein n=1 Tax=Bradyrhizobium valentinum TaxID=1518501 RepID=A0A0R3L1W9_9BRAD|nr:hypothetical protein [Bradyrhizobium valentinum]KRQ99282.1 hypothetical protein CP49_11845 [Bradyrhizobium valentinum]
MRRYDAYRIERNDNLAAPEFWNTRFQDIDLRLATRENDAERIDNAVDDLERVALQRLNDTFTPLIIEAQDRLNSLGASFSAESFTPLEIGLGPRSFILTEESAENYVYTDYVKARSAADGARYMLGEVVSFDRATKLLEISVDEVGGSGTVNDWLIRVGAPPDLTHAARKDNPHEVTAAQVGAWTTAEAAAAIAAAIAAIPGVDLSSRLARDQNLADLLDVAAARTALGLKLLATQDTVGWSQLAANIFATAANFRAKAANKLLTAEAVWDAAMLVTLPEQSGTITLDLSTGVNFWLPLNGSITLLNPINGKNGQSGCIYIYQGSGAGRTVSYGNLWYPINAQYPALSTATGASNYLTYQYTGNLFAFTGGKLTG